LENNKKFIGEESTVLIDNKSGDNWFGKNEHYKTVQIKSNKNLLGKFVKVKITEAMIWALKGEII
jgi:tRNA-2-methylthio-N6-dimethylallyladenosine synthase